MESKVDEKTIVEVILNYVQLTSEDKAYVRGYMSGVLEKTKAS